MTNVKIEGLDKLQKKIDRLSKPADTLKEPMAKALNLMWDYMAKAPRKSPGAFSRLATDKQRRAYWAKVRQAEKGGLPIHGKYGYIRTGTIPRSWVMRIQKKSNTSIEGELGNNAPGAVFVQGPDQQPFHKESGWRTTDEIDEKLGPKIVDIFERAIERELRR